MTLVDYSPPIFGNHGKTKGSRILYTNLNDMIRVSNEVISLAMKNIERQKEASKSVINDNPTPEELEQFFR